MSTHNIHFHGEIRKLSNTFQSKFILSGAEQPPTVNPVPNALYQDSFLVLENKDI